jgi:XTP/dITP diphosphohydrolase
VQRLLLATRNPDKTREFAELLGDRFVVRDLSDASSKTMLDETGTTFEANAIIKAVGASKDHSGLVVADDSGLEVDALNGRPGIFSARYAGAHAPIEENVKKLLHELRAFPFSDQRTARFRCVLALARDGLLLKTFTGTVEGRISENPRGNAGFGYDPIFIPEGFAQTFGELPAEVKNRISHRAGAVRALRQTLLRIDNKSA